MKEKREQVVQVRAYDAEKARWGEAAAALGVTISTWVRIVANKAAGSTEFGIPRDSVVVIGADVALPGSDRTGYTAVDGDESALFDDIKASVSRETVPPPVGEDE